jgi:hypothetical protein
MFYALYWVIRRRLGSSANVSEFSEVLHTDSPVKMELTNCDETLAGKENQEKAYNFTTRWETVSFSRRAVLCGVSEWVGEWVSGWERESEWVKEWVSEWVGEWVSGWVSEWVSEWLSEWVSKEGGIPNVQFCRRIHDTFSHFYDIIRIIVNCNWFDTRWQ